MRRIAITSVLVSFVLLAAGCSQDVFSSDTEFVCSSSADCAQGFECAETATSDVPICVPASRVGDAGALCNDGNPPQTFFEDTDGDGYGDAKSTMEFCVPEQGWVADASDCDDSDPNTNPDAPEVCNGEDNDCDGRADIPASGDPVCPRLIESMSPGDIASFTAASAPDGAAYVAASYRGSIDLGGETLSTPTTNRVLFEVVEDGSIGWVTDVETSDAGSFVPLAASSEYVAFLTDTDEQMNVGALQIPENEDGFASRVVLVIVDRETGDGLIYAQLTNQSSISASHVQFDSDGDVWVVISTSGEVDVGGQMLTLGASRTAVVVEFAAADDALTLQQHEEWLPGGEPAAPSGFRTGPGGAYVAGSTSPTSETQTSNLAHFATDGSSIDLAVETTQVEDLHVSDLAVLDDQNARLCGSFEDTVVVSNGRFISRGGFDALLADVRRSGADIGIDVTTTAASEADIECTYTAVLGDGSDVSVIENSTEAPIEIAEMTIASPDDRESKLLVGRDGAGTVRWTRQLLGTVSVGVNEVAPVGDSRFLVVGNTQGTLEVGGETIGTEDEPNGFLLLYENP